MIEELNDNLKKYYASWQVLVKGRHDKAFFEELKPVAIGWKVADIADYQKLYAELHDDCDRIVETWMNGRWIAKLHLRDQKLEGGVEIIKLMERRPGSDDALGLDHIDFYSPSVAGAEQILDQEKDLKWSHESNDVVSGYEWISVWFDGREAKLKNNTVLDIIIEELRQVNRQITSA